MSVRDQRNNHLKNELWIMNYVQFSCVEGMPFHGTPWMMDTKSKVPFEYDTNITFNTNFQTITLMR